MAKHFGNTQRIELLLAQIQAGTEEAVEGLIGESQERLRRLASKMLKDFPGVARFAGQTEDVLQPVLLRLCTTLRTKQFASAGGLIAYAAKMIRHELIDLARKYKREEVARVSNRPDAKGRLPLEIGRADPASEALAEVEKWDRFHETVERLPEDEKRVIELRCYGHWSRQETAVILGVDEKTVTRRYGRAMEKLGKGIKGISEP